MSTTLPLFWHLPSTSRKERIETSVKLISALEQFQDQFIQSQANKSDLEDDEHLAETDKLGALNAHDVSYTIRRLVRGLSSSRESSRLGFAVALTELLSRLNTVTAAQIISLICESSQTTGSLTGQEERDLLFARLFGLTAVVQSNLLTRSEQLAASASSLTSASGPDTFKDAVVLLKTLGDQRSYLRESAWWTICLAVDALKNSDVPWQEEALESLTKVFFVEDKQWTSEKVALTLKVQSHFPNLDWPTLLAPTFKNQRLLHSSNLLIVAKILKESTLEEDEANTQAKSATPAWKPQLHFAWSIILDFVLDSSAGPDESSQSIFRDFFRVVVDESLFSSTSSAQRKYWGFQVFQKALSRAMEADLSLMFTKNFMRTWINHLSHEDRYLHKAAKQLCAGIQAAVQREPQLGFTLILQLTGINGSRQFDRLTKTKTIENILASMNTEGILAYIRYLQQQMNKDANDDDQALQTRRNWAIDQFGHLIRNTAVPKSDEWVQLILDWLVANGLFILAGSSKKANSSSRIPVVPDLSDDIRAGCRTRLLSCLADLTSQTCVIKEDSKSSKVPAVASDGQLWVTRVLKVVEEYEANSKLFTPVHDVKEEDSELWVTVKETLAKVRQLDGAGELSKGAELLLSATILQFYCSNEDALNSAVLKDCVEGVSGMFPLRKKSKKSRKSDANPEEESNPEPIDILVDIIIGFMEKSSSYLRAVANQVFALLSGSVKESTVDLILAQLERRDPAELEDDSEVDTDAGSQIDEDSASELASDEEEDDDEEEDEDDNDEVRQKIEAALQANGIKGAVGESDSESEDLMDDDQMMAIDEQLAAVFRSRAQAKKSGKDTNAQREATHFKNRILDLVDTFIKRHATSPLAPRFVLPLVDVIAGSGSDEQQLSDKAKGILQTRFGKSKELPSESNVESLATALDEIHVRARKGRLSHLLPTLSQCSVYLVKVLLQCGAHDTVVKSYKSSLSDFITRKNSSLNSSFFEDFIRRCPSQGWDLRDDILSVSVEAANVYRQCQALHLVHLLLNQLPSIGAEQQHIETFMRSLRETLLRLLALACDEKTILNAAQMKEISKLVLQAVRLTVRIAPSSAEKLWAPESWTNLRTRLQNCERYKSSMGIQKTCGQVSQLVAGSAGKPGTKRKGDELDTESRATKKAKQKQKKNVTKSSIP